MSINVPNIGLVPVVWMPASGPDFGTGRAGKQPIAIVHHRIVGSLNSADVTFAANDADPHTEGSPTRAVSSHFGIGYDTDGKLYVHQYVDLSDTAYTNGDYKIGSNWDLWNYPNGFLTVDGLSMRACNPMTVTIEHDDQGNSTDPAKKGIVREAIIKTSIALDRLMLAGNIIAMREAGIKIREVSTAAALSVIKKDGQHLIDHHDIALTNKPYCWKPWSADKVGFPRARYIAELTAPAVEPTPTVTTYTQAQVNAAVAAATAALTVKLASAQTAKDIEAAYAAELADKIAKAKTALG